MFTANFPFQSLFLIKLLGVHPIRKGCAFIASVFAPFVIKLAGKRQPNDGSVFGTGSILSVVSKL
jgi:hypothetical protein